MARYTAIESRAIGERMVFLRTAEETNGELLDMEVRYNPALRWDDVPYHLHPRQDEQFTVLDGMLTVEIAGVRRVYVAGEQFSVPRGTEHAMRNLGTLPVRVRWEVRPALNTQQFFETTFGLADEGTLYHPLQFALLAREYADVFRLTRLPASTRALLPLLALMARLRGYRARYSRHAAQPLPEAA
jgi:mannose-6-phosphate isomerase-like protein (cupin superfamily)